MVNKKGDLPLNIVVVAILVLVVLVIVIALFVGQTGSVAQKIKDIFIKGVQSEDRGLATQFCENYCNEKNTRAWCKNTFKIDLDNDGKIKDEEFYVYCSETHEVEEDKEVDSLDLSCPEITQSDCDAI